MENTVNQITPDRKEATAITVMRCMLLIYAEEQHIPFEDAMLSFSQSKTYEDLFDFDTEIWKEGPEYLRCLYDEELHGASQAVNA
ncbi:hypothetical protein [Chordicoccus furentiruminis]|jgi:hypothetical protein|uniref:hypothetical protein n=1 Tax=Chordicoccus furentiruminis TaxID=2709410 RepID=UPI0023A8980C|nr:hypothetical protein [Chordicoccus furentiruminis]